MDIPAKTRSRPRSRSTTSKKALKKNFLELTELKHILRKTQHFFEEQDQMEVGQAVGQHQQLIQDGDNAGGGSGLQLGFVAGVILR